MHISTLLTPWKDGTVPLAFQITRRRIGSKQRIIANPTHALRELHYALLRCIEKEGWTLPSAHAQRARSIMSNVEPHLTASHFYLLDFAHAFGSVSASALADALQFRMPTLGKVREVETFLRRYCFVPRHGLAQGGPASSFLFELYCEWEVDAAIRRYLHNLQRDHRMMIAYTRYVDDLTFSAHAEIPPWVRRDIRELCTRAGFTVNHRKSLVGAAGDMAVEITGVRILRPGHAMPAVEFCNNFERTIDTYLATLFVDPDPRINGMIEHYVHVMRALGDARAINRRTRRIDAKIAAYRSRTHASAGTHRHYRRKFSARTLDAIRARLPVSHLAARRVALKRAGKEWRGLSPFKVERTPSFYVNDQKGFYHCFASGAHGDIFSFAMHLWDCSFVEAVQELAREVGVSLDYE